jgi:hypothetical protein
MEETKNSMSLDIETLLADVDRDILLAAAEVDTTLIEWLLSLSPLERVFWTHRQAMTINGLQRVEK